MCFLLDSGMMYFVHLFHLCSIQKYLQYERVNILSEQVFSFFPFRITKNNKVQEQ